MIRRWWRRMFLDERPSVSLSLFRLAVAVTVGCHMLPSFFHLDDNYLAGAFKETNASFFPLWALRLAAASPDWLVLAMTGLFLAAWCAFLIGFQAQLSCLLMTAACYYFYALNSLHIGTLSFDILLVTLSLMWMTGYHGDWLSVDSVLRGDPAGYRRRRPIFIQRLLQLQIAWTFFYTALSKVTAHGNWLTDRPLYYLMNYPPHGVVKAFPFRGWLAAQPEVCQWIEVGILSGELALPVLLFIRQARLFGLLWGFAFHILLIVTLHVPTIFFFLFPPQMLLFIEPEQVVGWIESARARRGRATLLYDGQCGFCQAGVRRLAALDVFAYCEPVDYHAAADLARIHPALTPQRCRSRMQLVEPGGRLSEGFDAARRLSLTLPLLWPLAPLLWLPGMRLIGRPAYDWIARRRLLWHRSSACASNQCRLP